MFKLTFRISPRLHQYNRNHVLTFRFLKIWWALHRDLNHTNLPRESSTKPLAVNSSTLMGNRLPTTTIRSFRTPISCTKVTSLMQKIFHSMMASNYRPTMLMSPPPKISENWEIKVSIDKSLTTRFKNCLKCLAAKWTVLWGFRVIQIFKVTVISIQRKPCRRLSLRDPLLVALPSLKVVSDKINRTTLLHLNREKIQWHLRCQIQKTL